MPSDRETAATAALSKNKKCRGRMPDGRPNPIDIHVGKRIRLRRLALNLSQETLAELLGITFQQIQKYENGGNRISASRLWDCACVLDVPVQFFFQGGLDSSGSVRTSGCSKRSFDLLPKDIWLFAFWVTQPPIIAGS